MTNRIYIQNQNCFNSPKGTENQYATNCMIILGVTCILMMNQDIKHLIGNEVQEPSVAQVFIKYNIPRLLGEHEFDIFINGNAYVQQKTLLVKFIVCICVYYVFNT